VLNLLCVQLREPLLLNAREQAMTFNEVTGWSIQSASDLFPLVLALCLPGTQIDGSGWILLLNAILVPLHRACFRRKPE